MPNYSFLPVKAQTSLLHVIIVALIISACVSRESEVKPEMQIQVPPSANLTPTSSLPTAMPHVPAVIETTSAIKPLGGIHLHYPIQKNWMDSLIQSGLHWTRLDLFFWDQIEPQKQAPPLYDWSKVDEASIIQLSENGIQLIAGILYTPEWAQKYPGIACGPIAEAEMERFAAFMFALVSRYSQPPFNIKVWEIGNEPDIDYTFVSPRSGFGCWGESNDPYYGGEYYAKVLQAVYPRVKEADPESKLLPGGLLLDCDPSLSTNGSSEEKCIAGRFLEGVLRAGGGAYIDGISFHGYDYYDNQEGQYGNKNWNSDWRTTGPVWVTKLAYLRNLLHLHGIKELPYYLTELATICGRDGSEEYCRTPVLQQTKAIYAVQSQTIAKAEKLEAIIWYGIEGWRASGMLQGGEPLPVYRAMSFFENLMGGAEYLHQVQEFTNITGYAFSKSGQEIWILWSSNAQPQRIELTEIPNAIYNVEGQEIIPPSKEMDMTVSPVYIIW
jgi:hypothetical protein